MLDSCCSLEWVAAGLEGRPCRLGRPHGRDTRTARPRQTEDLAAELVHGGRVQVTCLCPQSALRRPQRDGGRARRPLPPGSNPGPKQYAKGPSWPKGGVIAARQRRLGSASRRPEPGDGNVLLHFGGQGG